ncbi:EAL domain-containing protein [Vibrio sp. MA40-2]|uniref:sensor domain-containing protein n=1 Tax=Vibrio sp. MA40-2 TaxID=3391828 RepID=UPI0039A78726
MKDNNDATHRSNSHLFDALEEGFLAPNSITPISTELEHLVMDKKNDSSLFFSIVDQSSNAVVITDISKNIVYVNKKFEHLSGYSLQQVIGQNPRILKSNQTSKETYRDLHICLQAGKQWRGTFINLHRNGNEYIAETVISPIVNNDGEVICFLAEKKDITTQKLAEDRIQKLTHYDNLTGLPNRAHFINESESLLKHAQSTKYHSFSILFADLNKFKELNDTHGHLAGDAALKAVAERFSQQLTQDDFIARVGGDEFVIIHKHATLTSTALLAQKLVDSLITPITALDKKYHLGVSVGSANWPKDGSNLKELLSRSDLAMYKAKSLNKNYIAYTTIIGYEHNREVILSNKLAQAIDNQQFSLEYQPKYQLQTNKIVGLEALLRWKDPELGNVSPVDFIPIAEKHSLMAEIGDWVIQQACQQLKIWRSKGWKFEGRIAINISIQQIEQANFHDSFLAILNKERIKPTQIELEVTESILIRDTQKVIYILSRLEAIGVTIAIDDFGTGYSSLSYLKSLKANNLKIDRSFIRNVTNDIHDKTIVQSIVDLAHNLNLSVIAEGVETEQQLKHLMSIGCDMVQGFYFSKPKKPDDLLTDMLKKSSR